MTDAELEDFWERDDKAHKQNCFHPDAPQVALGIRMSDECVYAELGEDGDPWMEEEPARRYELNQRYNDRAEKIVGRRLLDEISPEMHIARPPLRRIGEVFGGTYEHKAGTGEWLHSPASTPKDLESLLDRVDRMDLADFMFYPGWDEDKARLTGILDRLGMEIPMLYRHVRGPVTLATSIYGVESLIFLHYDAPELFRRFSDTIGRVIVDMAVLFDREVGYTDENRPGGFSFADDDCCLMTPEMYRIFGYPVLEKVFGTFSPLPEHQRFQHSDSAMGHLLPQLADFNLTGCNFGPTVLVDEIRHHMPATRIDGCLAPFTFMRNNRDAIVAEVKRDIDAARATGIKGLNIFTAGSINNGSSLESMRLVMETIDEYGRY